MSDLRRIMLSSAVAALFLPAAASANSIVSLGAPQRTQSMVEVIRPDEARDVLVPVSRDAPDVLHGIQRPGPEFLSRSVLQMGQPAEAEPEVVEQPAEEAGLSFPMVIRGGMVGDAFPDAASEPAAPLPMEPRPRGSRGAIGADGNPISDGNPVDPGSSGESASAAPSPAPAPVRGSALPSR